MMIMMMMHAMQSCVPVVENNNDMIMARRNSPHFNKR